ncbi:hypothetical protein BDV93DRAFT_553373 [Ceratobasidium sp. AG-I]|nr:hypothetical protein BDV93DRAFT_553373 [Ceratobasidium sp. AG-I]
MYFDGEKVLENSVLPSGVNGKAFFFNAKYTDKTKQCYQFGKLQITDKEDVAPLDDPRQFELNTIKFVFRWVTDFSKVPNKSKKCKKLPQSKPEFKPKSNADSSRDSGSGQDTEPKDAPALSKTKLVHEKIAKKVAHGGSAILGPPVPLDKAHVLKEKQKRERQEKRPLWRYKHTNKEPVTFVFRYAPKEWLMDKGVIRSSAAVLPLEVNTIDDRDSLTPQVNLPPPSPSLCQPKAGLYTAVLAIESPVTTETDTFAALVDANTIAVNKSLNELLALLQPKAEPDITSSLPAHHNKLDDKLDKIIAIELPQTPIVPQKRLRESTPVGTIDVDMLSSDDEVAVLDTKSSKAVKRARYCKCGCGVLRPQDEDVKPKIEDIESKIESIKHEAEDIKPSWMMEHIHSLSNNSALDLWRLGC